MKHSTASRFLTRPCTSRESVSVERGVTSGTPFKFRPSHDGGIGYSLISHHSILPASFDKTKRLRPGGQYSVTYSEKVLLKMLRRCPSVLVDMEWVRGLTQDTH